MNEETALIGIEFTTFSLIGRCLAHGNVRDRHRDQRDGRRVALHPHGPTGRRRHHPGQQGFTTPLTTGRASARPGRNYYDLVVDNLSCTGISVYGIHYPELPTNRSYVADAELNKLLVAQRREKDPKHRHEIVDAIQRYLVDKAYYVYLLWQPQYIAHQLAVKGFRHPDGYGLGNRLMCTLLER